MSAIVVSPNMNLPIPVVGVEPGPQYAADINVALTLLDAHNHTSGSGVQITPAGLNINSTLTMNNQALSNIAALTLTAQTTMPVNSSIYSSGSDLYFVDGSGNNVRITQSGSVAGSTGTITGLPSGSASASFTSGTFVFQAATNTGANIDGASYILRNNTASSNSLTLSPPNSMGASYTLVLPSPNVSAATQVMTLDTAGNMGSISYDAVGQNMTSVGAQAIATTMGSVGSNIVNSQRTMPIANPAAINGFALSNSCGSFVTTSSTPVNITNMSVTITCTGRPLYIGFMSDGSIRGLSGQSGSMLCSGASTVTLLRNGTPFGQYSIVSSGGTLANPPTSAFAMFDGPGAGTFTYTAQLAASASASFNNTVMVAYEL